MNVVLPPELEKSLTAQARKAKTTPEAVIVAALREWFGPDAAKQPAPPETTKRQVALAAIQSGKYVRPRQDGDMLPSEQFGASKAEEKAREERASQ